MQSVRMPAEYSGPVMVNVSYGHKEISANGADGKKCPLGTLYIELHNRVCVFFLIIIIIYNN